MQVQAINTSMQARQANFGGAGKVANMAIAGLFTAASAAGAHATAPVEKAANKVLPGIESQAFFASNISKDGKVVSNFRPSEIQPAKTAELNAKAPVKALSNYYGIPKENIRAEYDFVGGTLNRSKSYKALFVYSKNSVNKGTNYVDEIYFVPKDFKDGEVPFKVDGIASVTAKDGSQSIGFQVSGKRFDEDYGTLEFDDGIIIPDQDMAKRMIYLITNNENNPYGFSFVNGRGILSNYTQYTAKDFPPYADLPQR